MRPVHTDTLSPGQAFGGYEIIGPVGAGTFGVVYEARTRSLGKRVALKVLGPAFSADATLSERFRREAEIVARLQHPHVVDIYDRGEVGDRMYIAMEFLEGETLTQALKRSGPMPVEAALALLLPILSAVSAVHALGVVHRDLKPGNLFLSSPRPGVVHPKLLDFGLVRVSTGPSDLTRVDASLGTPNYMSPEQITRPRDVDARSDVWSLGVILYLMLTGQRPFADANDHLTMVRVLEQDPAPAIALRPDLPPALDAALWKALRKDRDARHRTARAFAAALLPFAAPRTREDFGAEFVAPPDAPVAPVARIAAPELPSLPSSPPSSPSPDPSTFVRTTAAPPDAPSATARSLVWIAAAAAASLAMLGGAWYASRPRPQEPVVAAAAVPTPRVVPPQPPIAPSMPAPAAPPVAPPPAPPSTEEPAVTVRVAAPPHVRSPRPRDLAAPRPVTSTVRRAILATPPPETPTHDPHGVPILQ